ncbi:restriction endonuclease subunit S [Bacillus cereus]|uniref:restriction endonuclease subunit S n=1 Tax=Bacillus cereus TaxID=1396 RepID=UPI002404CE9D|nr:restriction endonuclease subunit S [Bacillus cereus]MDF9615762.1 restriction endonuclease subunit S [Bacillus cereus]
MKNKRTPEVRFPEFSGEWEKRNLGNISTKIGSGKTPKGGNQNYKSEGIPLLRSQNIFNDKVNFNDVVYITPEIDEDMANSRVQKGDVLLNITGASIGRSAVYKLNHKANVNQHVSIIRPSSEVNPYFIQLNITSEKGQKQIELNQAGGGREGLNFQQIAKMGFYFPSLVEQTQIGNFLKQLDDMIAFHQQELTILKQTKQGFLQKMFPKEGESVPEIRFPEFTGDWEERKLKDIVNLLKDGTHGTHKDGKDAFLLSAKNIKNGQIIINELNDRKISSDDYNSIFKNYKLMDQDLLITIVGTIGQTALYTQTTSKLAFQRSVAIIRGNKDINQNFLKSTVDSNYVQKQLKRSASMSAQAGVYLGDLEKLTISTPELSEQIKIGKFFKQLDETITLHQRELDALKETKKAFLQKMFA